MVSAGHPLIIVYHSFLSMAGTPKVYRIIIILIRVTRLSGGQGYKEDSRLLIE